MSHQCHAAGCIRLVPPRLFVCNWHWRRLPKPLQQAVWREYVPGQERSKVVSPSYVAVQQCAVAYLAKLDGQQEALENAAFMSVSYEVICRGKGLEPLAGLPRAWET